MAGAPVRLTVDGTTLQTCFNHHEGMTVFDTEEEAVTDFIDAVKVELYERDFQWKWISEPPIDDIPDFVALLAAQVLAVYVMHGDANFSKDAYWGRLAETLDLDITGNLPYGFHYADHQNLWRQGLGKWANETQEGSFGLLELPEDRGGRRHVKIPFSQALLRTTDLEQLGPFFRNWGYSPERLPTEESVRRALKHAAGDGAFLSQHARRVLLDNERFEPSLKQVMHYLRRWNGQEESLLAIAARSQKRDVELSLRIIPEAKPRLEVRVENSHRCKHHVLTEAEVHKLLRADRVNHIIVPGMRFRPRHRDYLLVVHDTALNTHTAKAKAMPSDRILLLVPWNQQAAWVSALDRVAVLESVELFLRWGTMATPAWEQIHAIPNEWCLLKLQLKSCLTNIPAPWDSIVDFGSVKLKPMGGLRLSRREWLAGAGPLIQAEGPAIPQNIFVDGTPVAISNGVAESSLLDRPGIHTITRIPNECHENGGFQIRVREAEVKSGRPSLSGGWLKRGRSWPQFADQLKEPDEPHVFGPSVVGEWQPLRSEATGCAPEREAILLQAIPQSSIGVSNQTLASHPIVLALIRRSQAFRIRQQGPRSR